MLEIETVLEKKLTKSIDNKIQRSLYQNIKDSKTYHMYLLFVLL